MILGIKITRSDKGIFFYQSHYMEKILNKYDYFDYKLSSISYDPNAKLFKKIGGNVRQIEYCGHH